ncbi:MAG: eukaryotic-like serine/threonine-protein kinase, partial [Alphaproteobacteria bacterium]|nr:eukaryotic-like serine/threonine-protein kinase [Alphaproteobacteria bacterium]
LGRYEIRSPLGAGGMGEVYLAQDTRLDRRVALKILPDDVAANQDRMRRFVQEAKAAAALNHPNIAHMYEIGESDGTNFIAMEFIDGVTLREKIHRERTELRKLLRYLQHVAEGLAKAHAAGIVHRDLKPDNIMITRDGHAKILDFGLAKLIESQLMEAVEGENFGDAATAIMQQHSTPGMIMGTVGYMSPEQAQGKTDQIDQRSDIFSFGCILFEAATGHKPFEGDSVVKSLHSLIYEPAPQIKDLNPSAPPDLQRIIRRCLAKDPEERSQAIKDVAIELKELRRALDAGNGFENTVPPSGHSETTSSGTTVQSTAAESRSISPAVSSAEYVVQGLKQHKLFVGLAVVILVGAVALFAYYQHARNSEAAIESIAVLPLDNSSSDPDTEYLADGLTESLIYRLSQLPNLKVSPRSVVFRYKGKETDPFKVGRELGVNAVLSGRVTQRGDNLNISAELVDVRYNKLLWGERYDRKTSELMATQREMASEIVDRLRLQVAPDNKAISKHYTESNEAYQLYWKGRFYWAKRTEEGLKKSIEYFNQAVEKDPNFALAYSGLADSYILQGAQDAGGTLPPGDTLPKGKAAALKAIAIDSTLAEPHVSLAHIAYHYDRDWTTAEREFKRAIELNPNYVLAHQWYALFLAWAGRPDEAVTEARRARDLDPLSLPANMCFGWVLVINRQEDQGIEELRKTIDLDPNFMIAHHRLGLGYEQKGRYNEAIAEFQKVRELSSGKPIAITALAHANAASGKREEAQRGIAELQQLSKREYVSPAMTASIYAALGDKEQAFAWLNKADKEHDQFLPRLKTDPRFDNLRSDPRFQELERRVSLPQ